MKNCSKNLVKAKKKSAESAKPVNFCTKKRNYYLLHYIISR